MPKHLSARLAWHMNGWNGHVCQNPAANTYCVGLHSYPGEMIAEQRRLEIEKAQAGEHSTSPKLQGYIPPCVYSFNAFGEANTPKSWWRSMRPSA